MDAKQIKNVMETEITHNYTRGPLQICYEKRHDDFSHAYAIKTQHGQVTADVYDINDARLYASAPKLLHALERMLIQFCNLGPGKEAARDEAIAILLESTDITAGFTTSPFGKETTTP